jgi:hypothetical protein
MQAGLQPLVVIAVALLGLGSTATRADQAMAAANVPTIRVEGDGWGRVSGNEIEVVLRSVAMALLPASAPPLDHAIVVSRGSRVPAVLYDRSEAGEYRVLLHAHDSEWHLYVYEFAHEFCHILSNYGQYGDKVTRRNQWFEEALCETASLFALTSVADRWQASPPTPQLAGSDRQLRWFFNLLINEEHRRPPAGGFATWLRDNEQELRQDPYQRKKNEIVANRLLTAFGADSSSWAALRYLNRDPGDPDCSLQELLDHWYRSANANEKVPVARIRSLLLEDPTVATASTAALR